MTLDLNPSNAAAVLDEYHGFHDAGFLLKSVSDWRSSAD